MLYRKPRRLSLATLWLRILLARHRRKATQDVRSLSPYLKRDLGLLD